MTLRERISNAVRALAGAPIYGRYSQYATYGDVDYTVPSERRQRQDYRGIFYRCLRMRAESVGDALMASWVERQSGQNQFLPVEASHPWYVLLRNPSKLWPARDVWEWASLSVDLAGKADFIVERDGRGMPVQLLPVFPEFGRMEVVPSPEGGVQSWVFYRDDGKIMGIPREDVVRLDNKSPQSPFETHSLIEAARFELDTSQSMKEYRAGSVQNGGITSPVITTDQSLSASQIDQLKKEWKSFVGVRGTEPGKVGVLANGMKPMQTMSAKDLEFIQGEAQTDKSIMIICGVPPGLFESTTTRATAEGAQVVFAQLTVSKLVSKYCEQLSHQFEIIFNADSGVLYVRPPDVVPLDKEYALKERQAYIGMGLRTINDYLREDGFTPDPNGNDRYIPSSLVPIEGDATEPVRLRSVRTEEREAQWRAIDKKKRRQAELTKPVIREWFAQMEGKVLAEVDANYGRKFSVGFDPLAEEYDFLQRLSPEVLRALRAGWANGMSLANITGLEFPLYAPSTEAVITTILSKNATVPATLYEAVTKTIQTGIEQKVSRSEMAAMIRTFFDGYTTGKVENIANGLTTSAWEAGQSVAYAEAGVTAKEWLSSRDDKVRDTHRAADGQRVDVNETFSVGTSRLSHPGDPNGPEDEVIGCRCVTLPVL